MFLVGFDVEIYIFNDDFFELGMNYINMCFCCNSNYLN